MSERHDQQLRADLRAFEESSARIFREGESRYYRPSPVLAEILRKAREQRQREKRKGLTLLAVVLLFAAYYVAQSWPVTAFQVFMLLSLGLVLAVTAAVPALIRAWEEDLEMLLGPRKRS